MNKNLQTIRSAQGTLFFILFLSAVVPVSIRDLAHQLLSSVHFNPIFQGYRKPTLAFGCLMSLAILALVWREAHRTLYAVYPAIIDGRKARPAYHFQHKEFFYWSAIAILAQQGYAFIWVILGLKAGTLTFSLQTLLPGLLGCVAGASLFFIPTRAQLKEEPAKTECAEKRIAEWTVITFFGYNTAFLIIDILGQWGLLMKLGVTSPGLSNKFGLLGALWLLPILVWKLPLGKFDWLKPAMCAYWIVNLIDGSTLAPGFLLGGLYLSWQKVEPAQKRLASIPLIFSVLVSADLVGQVFGYFFMGYEGGPLLGFACMLFAVVSLESWVDNEERLPFTTLKPEEDATPVSQPSAVKQVMESNVPVESKEEKVAAEPPAVETELSQEQKEDQPYQEGRNRYWDLSN